MKQLVDRLSADLSARYAQYLETFKVELWSASGMIEFRVGYSLLANPQPRSFTIKVEADAGETWAQKELLTIVVFDEIAEKIDVALVARQVVH